MHVALGVFADIVWKRVLFALPGLLEWPSGSLWLLIGYNSGKPCLWTRPLQKKTELKYEKGQFHGHPVRAPGPSHTWSRCFPGLFRYRSWASFLGLLPRITTNLVTGNNTCLFFFFFFYTSEGQKSKIKVSAGLCSFWRLKGESIFLPFPASGGHLNSLAPAASSHDSTFSLPSSYLLLLQLNLHPSLRRTLGMTLLPAPPQMIQNNVLISKSLI